MVYESFNNRIMERRYSSIIIRMLFLAMVLIIPVYDSTESQIDKVHVHPGLFGTAYCSKTISYTENVTFTETRRIKEPQKAFCWSTMKMCTKYKWVNKKFNETIPIVKTKIQNDCCVNYEKKDGHCIPICKLGCGNGHCIEPDICHCEPGWMEPNCLTECPPNKYGPGCKENCTCPDPGNCNRYTGFCECPPGFVGEYCESTCFEGTFGQDCRHLCECENDAICAIADGTCLCQPGYEGIHCEKPCANGKHGMNCEQPCICIPETTDVCHPVDGVCSCKPGYQGEACEDECDDFKYGEHCSKDCNCSKNTTLFCEPFDGECVCDNGWTGPICAEKCLPGSLAEECEFTCSPDCLNVSGTCDNVTGYCNCPPGLSGDSCEKGCSPGFWGVNCSNTCDCGLHMNCVPETGICLCSPGKNNSLCFEDCSNSWLGRNCSSECNCTCDTDTGICLGHVDNPIPIEKKEPTNFPGVLVFLSVILALVCLAAVGGICFMYYAKVRRMMGTYCCLSNYLSGSGRAESGDIPVHIANPLYGTSEAPLRTADNILSMNPASRAGFTNVGYDHQNETKPTDANKENGHDTKRLSGVSDITSAVTDFFQQRQFSVRGSKVQPGAPYSSTTELQKEYDQENIYGTGQECKN